MDNLKEKILELWKQGLSYNQIKNLLNCSKSTIAYHCNSTTKNVQNKYLEKYWQNKLIKAIWRFQRKAVGKSVSMCKDWNKKFRTSVSRFRLRNNILTVTYSYTDALNHLGGYQTCCYLTGRPIDIKKDDFQLDHIIPASKGGTNELSNMGITIPQANQMKSDLTVDELLSLCKEILIHHNYKVEDPT